MYEMRLWNEAFIILFEGSGSQKPVSVKRLALTLGRVDEGPQDAV
jgi:hypothetical protein